MSRAFVKEADDNPADELPGRPLSPHPNYVTPTGLAQLQSRVEELVRRREQLAADEDDPLAKQSLLGVKRDLRYFRARLESAIPVDPGKQPGDEVRFGAAVTVSDEHGKQQQFNIVGEDEADVAGGKISWSSPLGKAMIGSKVGDNVVWRRPAGDTGLEILSISYPPGNK